MGDSLSLSEIKTELKDVQDRMQRLKLEMLVVKNSIVLSKVCDHVRDIEKDIQEEGKAKIPFAIPPDQMVQYCEYLQSLQKQSLDAQEQESKIQNQLNSWIPKDDSEQMIQINNFPASHSSNPSMLLQSVQFNMQDMVEGSSNSNPRRLIPIPVRKICKTFLGISFLLILCLGMYVLYTKVIN